MTRHPLRGLRVVVIGGSLAGLFAANMLHRAGAEISVHERTPGELSARGAGIATHAELFDGMTRAGVSTDASIGVPIPGRLMLARDGTVIARHLYPQIMTGWGRLHHLLRNALPTENYRGGAALIRLEQSGDKARAVFADGQMREADLIVAADGPRSTVRAQYAPMAKARYAGYVAWRGMGEERNLSPALRATTFGWLSHAIPPGELSITYPVAGAADSMAPGDRRTNLVWYRRAELTHELRHMMTDESGHHHEHGIPPHLVSRAVIAQMIEAAERLLPPQHIEVVRGLDQPFFQPIIDLESPDIVFGRVVLIGDAAFVVRPHPGMGVTKAAGDALCLTDALIASRGAIDRALANHAAKRGPFGRTLIARGQKLGLVVRSGDGTTPDDPYATKGRDPYTLLCDQGKPPPWT